MWPWGHLVSGYLVYSLGRRAAGRPPPTTVTALALAFGTQFPDLVDKPLAWYLGVIPNGRSLAHSLITATAVCALVVWVAHRYRRGEVGVAFAVGYLAHLPGDAVGALRSENYDALAFFLWPVLPPVEYAGETSFAAHFAKLQASLTPTPSAELAIFVFALLVWSYDGMPGVDLLVVVPGRLRSALERR